MKLITLNEVCSCLSRRASSNELVRSGKIRTVLIGKRGVRVAENELSRIIEASAD